MGGGREGLCVKVILPGSFHTCYGSVGEELLWFAAWAREVKINMCAHSCTCMQFALCHRLQAVSSTRGGLPRGAKYTN